MTKADSLETASSYNTKKKRRRKDPPRSLKRSVGPSVFYIKVLDTVTHIVLEEWVADSHALLTPLQSSSLDGFHRVDGPAGEVSAQQKSVSGLSCTETGADRSIVCKQTHAHTLPVQL